MKLVELYYELLRTMEQLDGACLSLLFFFVRNSELIYCISFVPSQIICFQHSKKGSVRAICNELSLLLHKFCAFSDHLLSGLNQRIHENICNKLSLHFIMYNSLSWLKYWGYFYLVTFYPRFPKMHCAQAPACKCKCKFLHL